MDNQFSITEDRILQSMIQKKTAYEISSLLDKPLDVVKEKIAAFIIGKNIIPYEKKITRAQKGNADKTRKKEIEKEQKRLRLNRENEMYDQRRRRNEPAFKTKEVDYSQMISVRIDSRTILQVKAGTDVETFKKNYLERLNKARSFSMAKKDVEVKKFKPLK